MIPSGLRELPLSTLHLMATTVCVPEDAELQEWLATNSFLPTGLTCGRHAAAISSIDITVSYTPAARIEVGGTAEIEALTDLMIAETNQANVDSGVHVCHEGAEESGGSPAAMLRKRWGEGPPEPSCRRRLQTTHCCCVQEAWW